jgi:hypothetical protein
MSGQSYYQGIQHIVQIVSFITTGCEHCDEQIGGEQFAESVNHYIEKHGYKVLHVGTETSRDDNGKPWYGTVAVLGK